uniref:Uncharacterized protein n=1 Tax=Knipowitschia caucasica TaxID=637954 RepID=A0AAV2LD28_KNICA
MALLHGSTARPHCTAPLHGPTARPHCTAPLHGSTARLHCTAPLHGSTARLHCTAPLHGSTARLHCTAPLHGPSAQRSVNLLFPAGAGGSGVSLIQCPRSTRAPSSVKRTAGAGLQASLSPSGLQPKAFLFCLGSFYFDTKGDPYILEAAGGGGRSRAGRSEVGLSQENRSGSAEDPEAESVSVKERMAMYQAALSKKEPSSAMMDESEACSLPGGLASVKKQFESQEFSSSTQSTVTHVQYQQRSVQEMSSSSEVTVRSGAREVVPTTTIFHNQQEVLHDQRVTTGYGNNFNETVTVVGGEDLPKVSTQALKQQYEKTIEEAAPAKEIKVDMDINQFQWVPSKQSSEAALMSSCESSSTVRTSSATFQGENSFPPPPPPNLMQVSVESSKQTSQNKANKEQYFKQKSMAELKRLYKHINPDVRKNLEVDFLSQLSEAERQHLESGGVAGDVQQACYKFEYEGNSEGESGEMLQITTIRREETEKGDVKTSRWMFETQPIDMINKDPAKPLDKIKESDSVGPSVAKEEIPQADVKTTTWLFESTPFHHFNESCVQEKEIMGKSVKDTLQELYSQKMVESQGILIEADEIGDVRMAKYKLLNQDTPEIQKEEVIHGDLNNIMMNLLNRRDITERAITIDKEERGDINTTVRQLFKQEKGTDVEKEEIVRGDIQEAINNLLKNEGSSKRGILIQEDEKGDVKMTIYSLLNKESANIEKEDIIQGDLNAALDSLTQAINQKVVIEKEEVVKGDIPTTLRSLVEAQHQSKELEKPEIVKGDIKSALESLEKSAAVKTEATVDDLVAGDIKGTLRSLEEATQVVREVEKAEIVKGDILTAMQSLHETTSEKKMYQHQTITQVQTSVTEKREVSHSQKVTEKMSATSQKKTEERSLTQKQEKNIKNMKSDYHVNVKGKGLIKPKPEIRFPPPPASPPPPSESDLSLPPPPSPVLDSPVSPTSMRGMARRDSDLPPPPPPPPPAECNKLEAEFFPPPPPPPPVSAVSGPDFLPPPPSQQELNAIPQPPIAKFGKPTGKPLFKVPKPADEPKPVQVKPTWKKKQEIRPPPPPLTQLPPDQEISVERTEETTVQEAQKIETKQKIEAKKDIHIRTPSPTFISIESRKTDSPFRVTPSPPPYKSVGTPPPPPRKTYTPTFARASPSPTLSRSEKLMKLRDTTSKLSRGITPPPPMPVLDCVMMERERSSSCSDRDTPTRSEHGLVDTTEMVDSMMTVRDKKSFFEEAQKAEVSREYVRKDPIDIPERLGPDTEEGGVSVPIEILKDDLPRVDLSKLVNRFESPKLKRYTRKEPIVITERLGVDPDEVETEVHTPKTEEIPSFCVKAIKDVFETGELSSQAAREIREQIERRESEPAGHSAATSVSEQFCSVDGFGNLTRGATEMRSEMRSESSVTRGSPPSYADVVRGKVEGLPQDASTEELLRNFQQSWAQSQGVLQNLNFSVTEQRSSQIVTHHQQETVVTENSSSRVRAMQGMSEESGTLSLASAKNSEATECFSHTNFYGESDQGAFFFQNEATEPKISSSSSFLEDIFGGLSTSSSGTVSDAKPDISESAAEKPTVSALDDLLDFGMDLRASSDKEQTARGRDDSSVPSHNPFSLWADDDSLTVEEQIKRNRYYDDDDENS